MDTFARLLGTIAAAGPLTGGVWFVVLYFVYWAANRRRLPGLWTAAGLLSTIFVSGTIVFVVPRYLPNIFYIVLMPVAVNLVFFYFADRKTRQSRE